LTDPTNPFSKSFLAHIHAAAPSVGIDVHVVNVKTPDEFEAAFAEIDRNRDEAVIVQPTLPRKPVIDLALKHRLPSSPAIGRLPTAAA
jgi:DNA-binding LacI/PurR family transcriptional regulator